MFWLFSFISIMLDAILRLLNASVDDNAALARLWEDYEFSHIDKSDDSDLGV